MKLLSLRGSHYDIGHSHGEALAGEIKRFCCLFQTKLATNDISRDTALSISEKFGKFVEKHTPDLLEETKGIADGAGIEQEIILSLNCMFEIPRIAGRKEIHYCTAWGVTDGRRCIVVQNLDLAREYEEFLTLFHISPLGKREVLLQAMPGMISMLGMNREGLVFTGTTVTSRQASYGLPKPFISRTILHNCSNVTDATRVLLDFPRTTGGNVMLADASGNLRAVECSAAKCAVIYPENGYVAVTNHYTDDDLFGLSPPDTESSEARLGRIRWLLENAEKRDLETMFYFTRDHAYAAGDLSICRHGSISTVSSLIFLPHEKDIWIAAGKPCTGSFRRYRV